MEKLTHWKKLVNPDYLGAYSLEKGQSLILEIKEVKREIVKGTGGNSQECTIAYFKENQKPMILNRTNCKIIQNIHKTPYIEEWAGKKIEIYSTLVDAFGEKVEALRVKKVAPIVAKEVLKKDTQQWTNAVQKLENGIIDIAKVESAYNLSPEIKNELLKIVKK
jgi:hypothetical protein